MERTRGPGSGKNADWQGHPSNDWKKYEQAALTLEQLKEQPFVGSRLWPGSNPESWAFGELEDVTSDPDAWPELSIPKPLSATKQAGTVLKHVRNALAHGNIFTRGQREIEVIVFVAQKSPCVYKFNYLAVSPADFRKFFDNWLNFVRELRLPRSIFPDGAEDAA